MKRLLGVFLMACIVLLAATVTPYQPFEENFVTLGPVVTTKEATILDYMQAQLQANEGVANIAGYLYMDELLADVVMTSQADNETYLHQSRSGAYAFAGELFFSQASKVLDANSSLDMTRIYGHNMKIGTKFGSLAFLLDQANNRPLYYYDGVHFKTFTLARIFQFVDGTANFPSSINAGNVCANMHQSASVCARCCNHAPFPIVKAQIVGASKSANPQYQACPGRQL